MDKKEIKKAAKAEKAADKVRIKELKAQQKKVQAAKKIRGKEEKKRKKQQSKLEAEHNRYKIIESTQLSVPVKDILNGIIITKDARYLKIMEFAPMNFLMLSNAERNRVIGQFYSMLRVIPDKIQIKVFTRKAQPETMIQLMRKSFEKEKNEACRIMQNEYIELIKDTALKEGVTRRFFVIIEYNQDDNLRTTSGTTFDNIVFSLYQSAARIRSFLVEAGNLYLTTCDTDQGVNALLYEILNRRAAETEPFADRVKKVYEHYRNADISENAIIPATEFISPAWIDFKHPKHLVIDNKFYTFAYITASGYPNYVYAGWLSSFVNFCEGVDIDIFLNKMPPERISAAIGRRIRNNRAKLKETSDTSTEANNVSDLIESGFYLLNGLADGEEFFYSNILITITGDTLDQVNFRYSQLEDMARSMPVTIQKPIFQMEDAFESSLPLCKLAPSLMKKSRRNMLSSGVASLYPFISFEMQDPYGIMLGVNQENNSLVSVDVFDTTHHANANGAILGKSGYGKTFTAQLLAIRMRLQNIQTFIITPLKGKEDYKRACDQIDGQYIALGPGSPYYINIFDIHVPDKKGLQELDGDVEESLLAKKVQDLHTFFHLAVRNLTQEEEQVLDGYIYRTYERFGITEDNDSLYVTGTKMFKQFPLLGDLYHDIENEPVLRKVYNILTPMVHGSLSVYNHHTNVDLSNKYIVFDMNGTKGQNLILSMFVTLDFIWSKIKENRLEKKAVFIDEAWQLIGSQSNEMAAEYVKEIFKTIRAFGGAAFVMTQEISDFFSLKDGEYGKAIISNSDTKICLHLDKMEADLMSEILVLSPQENKRLQNLAVGYGLVATGNNKLFVQFKASQFETDVITTDPEYLRQKLAAMQRYNSTAEVTTASSFSHVERGEQPVLDTETAVQVPSEINYETVRVNGMLLPKGMQNKESYEKILHDIETGEKENTPQEESPLEVPDAWRVM